MGLIHEAKKQGLWPDRPKPERHKREGGITIESAEGTRFAHTTNPLPREVLPEVVPVSEVLVPDEDAFTEE